MQEDDRVYIADVSATIGVVDAYATYYKADTLNDNEIWNVGVALPVVKDLKLSAEYMHGDAKFGDYVDLDNNGYAFGLAYKGAKAAKPAAGVYMLTTSISRHLHILNIPLMVMLLSILILLKLSMAKVTVTLLTALKVMK